MVTEVKAPSPGESITEVQIANWLKNDGDYVEKDEEIAEIDSDKATLTLPAEESGLLKIKVNAGETIAVGDVIATIDTDAKAPEKLKKEKPKEKTESQKEEKIPSEEKTELPAKGTPSPAAEKLMRENELKPDQVNATGKGGRITKGDVLETLASSKPQPIKKSPAGETSRETRQEKLSMLRKKLSQRLVAVKNETAMLTTFNEVDMSSIIRIRKKFKDPFKEKYGVGLGFMSFFTRAVCEALKEFPAVNAMIDGDSIIYHDYCDIGIAVSAPKGLMVPVIRNAESLSFSEIETQIVELANRAREGKLTIDEMTGGTFTITNGGVFGSMLSTPIINPPQSAILGMHNIVERPVAVNGNVEIRPIMFVALSYDHRIIDGKESVSFLVKVKNMLEDPIRMIYGGNDPEGILLGL